MAASTATQSLTLLTLPAEIKIKIYEYVAEDTSVKIISTLTAPPTDGSNPTEGYIPAEGSNSTGAYVPTDGSNAMEGYDPAEPYYTLHTVATGIDLLFTCKQTAAEARPFLLPVAKVTCSFSAIFFQFYTPHSNWQVPHTLVSKVLRKTKKIILHADETDPDLPTTKTLVIERDYKKSILELKDGCTPFNIETEGLWDPDDSEDESDGDDRGSLFYDPAKSVILGSRYYGALTIGWQSNHPQAMHHVSRWLLYGLNQLFPSSVIFLNMSFDLCVGWMGPVVFKMVSGHASTNYWLSTNMMTVWPI